MDIHYRAGEKRDCSAIAELDYIASGGAAEFLFRDLVANKTPVEIIAQALQDETSPYRYGNALVAESAEGILGMTLSYPSKFHCIDDSMREYFPADRLAHFADFFQARVENSYYMDAFSIREGYQGQGIGQVLLQQTERKAIKEGYRVLSLLVFADNHSAIRFYYHRGFERVRNVNLASHTLIPHEGGCLLLAKYGIEN